MAGSSNQQRNVEVLGSLRRERPWLYPYNRRLRHLQGISIRNLSINAAQTRPRSTAVDDEALPFALKSPSKALSIREHKQLEHSRSQTNLRPIKESDAGATIEGKENALVAEGEEIQPSAKRPKFAKLRRRSTLEWVNASPQARQKKLETMISARMVDVFFSLHVNGLDDPIYISEAFQKVMNPDFRFFNLSEMGPSISRLEDLTVKVWAKSEAMDDYKFHIQMDLSLRSLQFIGKTMASWHQPLPQNCILFHMKDGIYTSFTDMPAIEPPITALSTPQRALSNQVLPTSSYDALMRLSTLDDCIQDALHTRAKVEKEMNEILEEHKESLRTLYRVHEKEQRLTEVYDSIAQEKKTLTASRKRRDELLSQISQTKESIAKGRASIATGTLEIQKHLPALTSKRNATRETREEILGQRRRICTDIQKIFPIEPIPNGHPLHFTILNMPLPPPDSPTSTTTSFAYEATNDRSSSSANDKDDKQDEEKTAAAYGHISQTLQLLQFYLSTPLPYPLTPRGSTSLIHDPISTTSGSKTYPLFQKGAIPFRFHFAVFLLNKDIEICSNRFGIRVGDGRCTLANLKVLMAVVTAGRGGIPGRKLGGVRGFLRGGCVGSFAASAGGDGGDADGDGDGDGRRRGSAESDDSSASVSGSVADGKQALSSTMVARKLLANANGNGNGNGNGVIIKGGYGGLGVGVRGGSKLRHVI